MNKRDARRKAAAYIAGMIEHTDQPEFGLSEKDNETIHREMSVIAEQIRRRYGILETPTTAMQAASAGREKAHARNAHH